MRTCNGIGCNGAWDCDNCRRPVLCEKKLFCDSCGEQIYSDETYFEIDGEELCEDCMYNEYGKKVDCE